MKLSRDQVNALIKAGQSQGLTGQAVLDGLVRRGYEPEGVNVEQAKQTLPQVQEFTPRPGLIKETFEDVKQLGREFKANAEQGAEEIKQIDQRQQGGFSPLLQGVGALSKVAAKDISSVFKAAVKVASGRSTEEAIKEQVGDFGQALAPAVAAVAEQPEVKRLVNWYNNLDETKKANVDALGGIGMLALEFVGTGAGSRLAGTAKEATGSAVRTGKQALTSAVSDLPPVSAGVKQTATELLERVPRAVSRAKEAGAQATLRADRISQATPKLAEAIKVNVDEALLAPIEAGIKNQDKSFIAAAKKAMDIAEDLQAGKVKITQIRPEKVAGDIVAEQYDLLEKARKSVGKEIGEAAKKLDKTTSIDLTDAVKTVDDILAQNGVKRVVTEKGVKWDFAESAFTPTERTKIKELYRLATENINAKPSTIYNRNQLFSKLQRQANFEGIGNIFVNAGDDTTKSLFSVFRDTFATKLDDLDPTIRELNKRYTNIMQKVEDVESTLAKSGKTNAADEIGLAEFAKTNLRRVLSDAQSAAEYQAVLNNLDDFARQAGYAGARADDVIEFATKLRNLYPETIPPTGFAGGIRLGTQGIVEKLGEAVMKAGAPNVVDQRRALKALLDSLAK